MKGRAAEGEGLLALSQRAIRTALEGLDLSEIEDILGINRQEELGRFIDPRANCTLDEEIRYASEKLSDVVRYVADDEGEIKRAMQSVRRNVETVRTDRKRASMLDPQYWMGRLVELERAEEAFWAIGESNTARCQGFCLYARWVIEEWIAQLERHEVRKEGPRRTYRSGTDLRRTRPRLDLFSAFSIVRTSTLERLQQHNQMFGEPPSEPKDVYRGQYSPSARGVPAEMPADVSRMVRDQLQAIPSVACEVLDNERKIRRSEGTYARIGIDGRDYSEPHAADVYFFRGVERNLKSIASNPQDISRRLHRHLEESVLPRLEADSVLLEVETKTGFCEQVLLETDRSDGAQ